MNSDDPTVAEEQPVPVGRINWGDLRRLMPLSHVWGIDRGRPLDRYYIENFLERCRADIAGRVLEVKDPGYTDRFGTGVTRSDVLDRDTTNHRATIVEDLTKGDSIPSDAFDCFVFTQTLHIIYDLRAALSTVVRILKPGGVVLCTLPSVSRVHYEDGGLKSGDFWRFTAAAVRRLFAEFFPPNAFTVDGYGNVLTCAAFLYGVAPDELTREELDFVDPWFPLIFCVRAVKPRPPDAYAS
jgi:SAM-dependent methyltransferase